MCCYIISESTVMPLFFPRHPCPSIFRGLRDDRQAPVVRMDRELVIRLAGAETGTSAAGLRLSLWDFGGQEVFYVLHHLYLTRFAAYAVLFNMQVCNLRPAHALKEFAACPAP
jgi:hypothetical protein